MSLLAPWALWLAPVLAAVVALYLLKVRRQRSTVPALDFWLALAPDPPMRSLLRRLKRWISLALWLLMTAAVLLALADPVLSLGRATPRSIAVVLDNSTSMQTVEADGQSRFELAHQAVGRLTRQRPVSDRWLLIESGVEPRVAQGWTRDRAAMRRAAYQVEPALGSPRAAAAIDLARQLLEGKPNPTIIYISDRAPASDPKDDADPASPAAPAGSTPPAQPLGGAEAPAEGASARADASAPDQLPGQAEPAPPATPSKARIEVVPWIVGETTDNLGITRIAVRPQRRERAHYVYTAIENASDELREGNLVFELDGSVLGVEPFEVAARGRWDRAVTFSIPEGGVLRASLDTSDALAADDEAFAVLQPLRAATIAIVSDPAESIFIEQAVASMPELIDFTGSARIRPENYEARQAELASIDLVIFNNWSPPRLPDAGRFVLINTIAEDLPVRVIGALEGASLSIADRGSPLLAFLEFAGAGIGAAPRLEALDGAAPLVTSADGDPLIVHTRQPGRESLLVAFDVLQTDLPFRNSFPLLLRNAIIGLVSEQASWTPPQVRVGESIRPLRPLPRSVESVQVGWPDDQGEVQTASLPVAGSTFTFPSAGRIGPLRFQIGEETDYTGVNVLDAQETRIAPGEAPDPGETIVLSATPLGAPPWAVLLAAAGALVLFEWMSYHMRWTE